MTMPGKKRWQFISGGVTAAAGFRAAGVSAGIKRSRKPDLSLVVADEPVAAAAVFTKNKVQAAPVQISRARLKSGQAQAVLINSGCANCMTGEQGKRDALVLSRDVARQLAINESDVLIASTGLIGRKLPVPRMRRAVPHLIELLGRENHRAAAQAILTTDIMPKEAAVEAVIQGRKVRLGGMAKGAGMIAPSMATMLCAITTDAAISPADLRALLQEAVERTFNRISVDGDMSTNDTVFVLASGYSGAVVRQGGKDAKIFAGMLEAVAEKLAELIVQDGEGATRLMEVRVVHAKTQKEALACARQVAFSPLVKTMLAGGDPNVGRIAGAVGASPARFDADHLDIYLGPHRVVAGGVIHENRALLRELLSKPKVDVRIDLKAGSAEDRMLTCDLTHSYVRINAGYAT